MTNLRIIVIFRIYLFITIIFYHFLWQRLFISSQIIPFSIKFWRRIVYWSFITRQIASLYQFLLYRLAIEKYWIEAIASFIRKNRHKLVMLFQASILCTVFGQKINSKLAMKFEKLLFMQVFDDKNKRNLQFTILVNI